MTKQLRITVDGKTYYVTVEVLDEGGEGAPKATAPAAAEAPTVGAPISRPINRPVAAPTPAAAGEAPGGGGVVSPLAGTVIEVHVVPGQSVAEGDPLVTLEAMKMNTMVSAPRAGKVTEVKVQKGAVVGEAAVLVVLG